MKKILYALAILVLTACGVHAYPPDMGRVIGSFTLSGGGAANIHVFETEGTKCIVVGRYSALAISCNWSK